MKRIFTLQEYWEKLAEEHRPSLSFKNAGLPFDEWKPAAYGKLAELLGKFPEKVPLNAEVLYSVDQGDYIRRKVVFDVDKYMSVPAVVLIPKSAKKDKSTPAILCSHGHGPFGKDSVTGMTGTPERAADVAAANYNFAEQMAKEGFVTISPDLRGFGERRDKYDPIDIPRDPCNLNYVKGSIFGVYPLTLNIWDFKCCIDYLETMDEVDPDRIGMMGMSQGGTMTTFVTAVEPRIKACDIISYVNPFDAFGIRDGNFCGSQVLPNLYRYMDTFDVAGLIAPRPCLMEMGIYDACFPFEDLWRGYEETKRIFDAAGAGDKLVTDIHPHGHAFSGVKAPDFFRENL
ncbi:MAG: acetylxylan esterase [Clostridia bacterium]|nr:acetylxylan esterase [Clostridia bacterium]